LVFKFPKLIILRCRIKHLLKNAVKGISSKGKFHPDITKNVERRLQKTTGKFRVLVALLALCAE
jgi:hypothetical protein